MLNNEFFEGLEDFAQVDEDEEYFTNKAWFCLVTGIAPSEYEQMTPQEVNIFVDVQKKINKKNR